MKRGCPGAKLRERLMPRVVVVECPVVYVALGHGVEVMSRLIVHGAVWNDLGGAVDHRWVAASAEGIPGSEEEAGDGGCSEGCVKC
jgi:hypothetical protein